MLSDFMTLYLPKTVNLRSFCCFMRFLYFLVQNCNLSLSSYLSLPKILFIASQSLYCSNQVSISSDKKFLLKNFYFLSTPSWSQSSLYLALIYPQKYSSLRIPSGVSMNCEILYSVSRFFYEKGRVHERQIPMMQNQMPFQSQLI